MPGILGLQQLLFAAQYLLSHFALTMLYGGMWYCLVEGVNNVKDSFTVEGDGPSVTAKWLTVSIE